MKHAYYLFDSKYVQKVTDAALTQGAVEKIVTNARWADQYKWTPESHIPDWEHRVSILYPNVEYTGGKYKMWYFAQNVNSPVDAYPWTDHIIDKNNTQNVELGDFQNTAKGIIHEGRDVLCYMESDDGIHWIRPDLGEFYYQTRTGEIVGTNIAYIGMHGLGIRKNENPDPNEPAYLMAGTAWDVDTFIREGLPIGVAISYSDDGFHWEDAIAIKTGYECTPDIHSIRADTHNQLFWSAELGRYVVITRGYTKKDGVRVIAYLESTDNLKSLKDLSKIKVATGEKYWEKTSRYWTCPQMVLDHNVTSDAEPYSMPVAHLAEGCYGGVVSVANFNKKTSGVLHSVHAQLTWSRNGKDWHYMDKGNPFIPNASAFSLEPGNDYGMIYCAAPVSVDGKTEIFYSAIPELHYANYNEIPAAIKEIVDKKIPKAQEAKMFTRSSTLNIARMKKDRYAGYLAANGSVTTSLFAVSGDQVTLTADIKGSLKIEVLDEKGNVIDGYKATILEDVTDEPISWNGKNLSALTGQKIAFRFSLNNACIYTIGGEITYES